MPMIACGLEDRAGEVFDPIAPLYKGPLDRLQGRTLGLLRLNLCAKKSSWA
jgi:hypothetical protein